MAFEPAFDWASFWAMPPANQDERNLDIAGIKKVLMPLRIGIAALPQLKAQRHKRRWYVWRVDEGTYDTDQQLFEVSDQLGILMSELPTLGAQLGNEFHHGLDWTADSPDWGNKAGGAIWIHRWKLNRLIDRLRADHPSLYLIAQGWEHTQITETDPDEPGRDKAVDILADVYRKCDAGSLHAYEFAMDGIAGGTRIDVIRFKATLDRELARLTRLGLYHVFVDEANIVKGTDVEQMRACIEMAKILADPALPYHKRVRWFSPFVATGNPGSPDPAWNPNYLIRDEMAYHELGKWLQN